MCNKGMAGCVPLPMDTSHRVVQFLRRSGDVHRHRCDHQRRIQFANVSHLRGAKWFNAQVALPFQLATKSGFEHKKLPKSIICAALSL